MKKLLILSILSLTAISPAFAAGETVATVANKVIQSIDSMPGFLSALSYISGIVLGIKGILKLKEHNESKGQVKLVIPIVLIASSAMLLALPTLMTVGIQTVHSGAGGGKEYNYSY